LVDLFVDHASIGVHRADCTWVKHAMQDEKPMV
jgi:hypothetical protein